MNVTTIISLIEAGATDKVRKDLKREAIKDRLVSLNNCIPHVKQSANTLNFFQKNFATEIGAIISAKGDLEKAEHLYREATNFDKSRR